MLSRIDIIEETLTIVAAGRMCAIGQLISYVIGSIDTVSIFGSLLGDTQFKQMTVIAAMSLVLAVAVTSYSVKERVLISARWVNYAAKINHTRTN